MIRPRVLPAGLLLLSCLGAHAQQKPDVVTIPYQLTLPEAEKLLYERNLAVAVNRRQLEAAEAQKMIAGYKPNPVVQLGAEQLSIYSPLSGAAPRLFSTNPDAGANSVYSAQFQKLIERGGKREFRTKQAEAQVAAARAQIQDTYRQQLFQMRQAFGAALLARQNAALAATSLEEYERTEKLTVTRVENGDAPLSELYRVRSGKLPYQQAVLQARTAYQQASLDLLNLLNAQSSDIVLRPGGAPAEGPGLEVLGDFSEQPVSTLLADLKREALVQRPDVEIAQHSLEAGEFGTRLAEAQRKRDLTVTWEWQRVGDDHTAGITTQFPLFLYNNQKAGIAQAKALERAGELQLRQARIQAATDVEKAYRAYLAAREALRLYSRENLDQVEKLRTVAFFSYREGASSLFELLDAQRTANQARAAYAQARADYQNSLWQLEAAVGKPLIEVKP